LGDGRALLPNRHIDAIELDLLVVERVDRFLVEDGVEDDGGLAGLAVADDELALAAADGISASMAFRPVCIGSCTDWRG
jgi:hypothetical protein